MPAVLARLAQFWRRAASPCRLPPWLASWLGMRKQLGVLTFWLLLLHIVISTLLFVPSNYTKFFLKKVGGHCKRGRVHVQCPRAHGCSAGPPATVDVTPARSSHPTPPPVLQNGLALATSQGTALNDFGTPKTLPTLKGAYALVSNATSDIAAALAVASPDGAAAADVAQAMMVKGKYVGTGSRLTWSSELCLLLGVMAAAALSLPALTSLPAIGASLNWREWRLLQGGAGSLALVLATAHVMMLGIPNAGW